MPSGFQLGSAWLSVEPDLDGFDDKVRAGLEKSKTTAKVPVEPDTRLFSEKLDAALLKTKSDSVDVKVKPDVDKARFAAAGNDSGSSFTRGFNLKVGAISSLVGLAMAALPAVAGPALILAGAGAGAAFLLATNKQVKAQGQTLVKTLTGVMTSATRPMVKPLEDAFSNISVFAKGLTPVLTTMFSRFGALLKPVLNAAESLLSHVLPGINAFLGSIKGPMGALSGIMGNLGTILGRFIASLGGQVMANSVTALGKMVTGFGELVPILSDLIGFSAALLAHLTPSQFAAITVAVLALVVGFKGATAAIKVMELAGISFEESNPFGWIALAITGIVLLSAAIVKYHKQIWSVIVKTWSDVRSFVTGAWHEVLTFIEKSPLLAALGLPGLIAYVVLHFGQLRKDISGIWSEIKGDAVHAWADIAKGIGSAFNAVVNAVKMPINFVLTDVIDKADGFLNHIPGVHLPTNLKLAGGGVLPGYLPGVDSIRAMLSPGEAVLTPGATRALGADTINALNAAHAPAGLPRGAAMQGGVLHAAFGFNPITAVGHALSSGAKDLGHLAVKGWDGLLNLSGDALKAAASGLINTLISAIPGSGQALEIAGGIAKAAASGLIGALTGRNTPGSGPAGGPTSASANANGMTVFDYLLANVFGNANPVAAAGAVASLYGESELNPFAQGTGGRGLYGATPPSSISDAAFSGGLRTQLPALVQFISRSGDWGVIDRMKSAATVQQAAEMWGQGVERYGLDDVHPAGLQLASAILSSYTRGGTANKGPGALAALHGHQGGRMNGGAVRRGSLYTVGEAGPELFSPASDGHVFSNQQSAAMAGNTVTFQYFGPQMPTPEMQAQMKLDLARALGPFAV